MVPDTDSQGTGEALPGYRRGTAGVPDRHWQGAGQALAGLLLGPLSEEKRLLQKRLANFTRLTSG